jgi:hypothetical protein
LVRVVVTMASKLRVYDGVDTIVEE